MKLKNYILTLTLIASLTGCSNFLEEYSQDTDYVRTWKDLNELLIGGCYMQVSGTQYFYQTSNQGQFIHLLADEMEENNVALGGLMHFDDHPRFFGYYTWQQRTGQNEEYTGFYTENTAWTQVYKNINVANNVIKSANDVPQKQESEIMGVAKVTGEAHFLRAYYYFWLVNLYGKPYDPSTASTDLGVPIKTNEEVEDTKFQRNTVQEVYDLVLSDLLDAEKELSIVTTAKKSIYRADSTAVNLLLSRVYLYMQNWQKAAEYAQKVINEHPDLQDLNTNTSKFMKKSNTENIFSMGGDDVPSMMEFAYQSMRVSTDLFNAYSDNDLRKEQWYWTYGPFHGVTKRDEGTNYASAAKTSYTYYTYMYCDGLIGAKSEVSSLFCLRSAEAYLNLAEAEAYMGDEGKAREALNTLRVARIHKGAPELTVTATGSDLITAIRKERRLEFAFEGQRWFDLRRYRVCAVQPEKISLTHNYTYYVERGQPQIAEAHQFVLTENDASWTLPIPQEVIEFNTGMVNNGNQWRTYSVVPYVQ